MISFFACEWGSPKGRKPAPTHTQKMEIAMTKSRHKDTGTGTGTVADTVTDTDTVAGTDTVADTGRMEGLGPYYRTLTTIAVMLSRPPREFAI